MILKEEGTKQVLELIKGVENIATSNSEDISDLQTNLSDNYYTQVQINNLLLDKLSTDGNSSNTTATFTQATTRENITSGSTLSNIFGKISKFFADLKTVAFTNSYNDLDDTPDINNGQLTIQKMAQMFKLLQQINLQMLLQILLFQQKHLTLITIVVLSQQRQTLLCQVM